MSNEDWEDEYSRANVGWRDGDIADVIRLLRVIHETLIEIAKALGYILAILVACAIAALWKWH